jgi:hypothetical protein
MGQYLTLRYMNCSVYPVWIQHTYAVYLVILIVLFFNFLIRSKLTEASKKQKSN